MRFILAAIMMMIGIQHFKHPAPFERIVPNYLPAHHALVLISGFFEAVGGLGLIVPQTRKAAAWGLVVLYIAVFPANINMLTNPDPSFAEIPRWMLWARLPLQAVLIAWAAWFTRGDSSAHGNPEIAEN